MLLMSRQFFMLTSSKILGSSRRTTSFACTNESSPAPLSSDFLWRGPGSTKEVFGVRRCIDDGEIRYLRLKRPQNFFSMDRSKKEWMAESRIWPSLSQLRRNLCCSLRSLQSKQVVKYTCGITLATMFSISSCSLAFKALKLMCSIDSSKTLTLVFKASLKSSSSLN